MRVGSGRNPHPFLCPKQVFFFSQRGFSLIEVVIALGIVSFAVVGIVGMMPIALKSGQESMRETDATLIAQRLFSELKTGSGGNRTISTSSNGTSLFQVSANSTNTFISYSADGLPQALSSTNPIYSGYDFVAQIICTNAGIANLSTVQIDITHPASAPPTARTTNSFVTLLGF